MRDSSLLLNSGQYSGNVKNIRHVNGLIFGTTIYTKNDYNTEYHYHENPHLSFILHGGNLENRKNKHMERKVGDIMFFHSGELHQTLPAKMVSQNINLEAESLFLKRYNISENDLSQAVTQNPDGKFLILKMYKELLISDSFCDISIQMLFLSIIANLKKDIGRKTPTWINRLAEMLNDDCSQFYNLTDLSNILQVHPVTISRYFTKYFGCTLGEYLRKIKVEKSITLIRSKKHSLSEIAMECGFADQSHFIRNFKLLTGLLPKEFQRL